MGSLFETKNFPEKFFCVSYFRGAVSVRGISVFFWGSLFQSDFLGKKICDKLFGLYSKKTRGTGGGGGSGPGRGEIPPGLRRKTPGQEWNFPFRGHIRSSTSVRACPIPRGCFRLRLLLSFGYVSKKPNRSRPSPTQWIGS